MFKAYDVRGKYGSEVTDGKFFTLGAAAAKELGSLVVGCDYREKNLELAAALSAGIESKGKETTYLGMAPSGLIAFSSHNAGVAITASHNPAGYNGAKFFARGTYLDAAGMARLEKEFQKACAATEETTAEKAANAKSGAAYPKLIESEEKKPVFEKYFNSLPEIGGGVYDLCGGAACAVKDVFRGEEILFQVPDPRFDKHSAEPVDSALGELKKATVARGKVGFAFDGDADRLVVVDKGRVIDGAIAACFIAENTMKKAERVVISIDCPDEAFQRLRDAGLKPSYSPVGDPLVVASALEHDAAFSAERSGHFIFYRQARASDGIRAAAVVSGFARPGELAEYAGTFRNVSVIDAVFHKVDFAKLAGELRGAPGFEEITEIDGIKAVFDDFTILVRASKTEPKVRINAEAATREKAGKGMAFAKRAVLKCVISGN